MISVQFHYSISISDNIVRFHAYRGYFTYAESNNTGPGADTSKRVSWEKKLTGDELGKFVNLSFINADGWLGKLPLVCGF